MSMYVPIYTPPSSGAGGGGTLDVISDSTLGADAANFDVTSIPGTFAVIEWFLHGRLTTAGGDLRVRVRMNNDSGSNYSWERVFAHSGGAGQDGSNSDTSIVVCELPSSGAAAGRSGAAHGSFPSYASTTFHKNVIAYSGYNQGNDTGRVAQTTEGIWLNTAAITRLTFIPAADNFLAGTRLILYGRSV